MSGAARPLRACTGEALGGPPGAGAHSPCGEARAGTRSDRVVRRRCTLPLRGGARRSRCGGRTGAGARSLTGGAAPVALWRADRRRCTLPYGRRGAGRAVEGGPAWVHAPLAGRRGVGTPWIGEPAQVHAPLTGRRSPVGLSWVDRRRCTLPSRGGAEPVTLWWADRHGCTLPYGRRGAGRAVEGGPAQVHAPLREALAGHAVEGGTGAGARSLAGGAEHRLPIAARDRTYVRTLTINPLDKACQVSLAREIGCGGQGCAAPAYPRPHPNPLPAETFALLGLTGAREAGFDGPWLLRGGPSSQSSPVGRRGKTSRPSLSLEPAGGLRRGLQREGRRGGRPLGAPLREGNAPCGLTPMIGRLT